MAEEEKYFPIINTSIVWYIGDARNRMFSKMVVYKKACRMLDDLKSAQKISEL